VVQGLYLKRSKEISEEFSRVFTEDVLTAKEVVHTMVHGERSERISAQPPAEFQDLICPIFHEDEWILVAIGGALGALVGWGQLVLLFGERLIATGVNVG
jgi:uncharacterized membrane protein YheB (UPF0754 family)